MPSPKNSEDIVSKADLITATNNAKKLEYEERIKMIEAETLAKLELIRMESRLRIARIYEKIKKCEAKEKQIMKRMKVLDVRKKEDTKPDLESSSASASDYKTNYSRKKKE